MELMTAEKMFGKSIKECNPIERSLIQGYNVNIDFKKKIKLLEEMIIKVLKEEMLKMGHNITEEEINKLRENGNTDKEI